MNQKKTRWTEESQVHGKNYQNSWITAHEFQSSKSAPVYAMNAMSCESKIVISIKICKNAWKSILHARVEWNVIRSNQLKLTPNLFRSPDTRKNMFHADTLRVHCFFEFFFSPFAPLSSLYCNKFILYTFKKTIRLWEFYWIFDWKLFSVLFSRIQFCCEMQSLNVIVILLLPPSYCYTVGTHTHTHKIVMCIQHSTFGIFPHFKCGFYQILCTKQKKWISIRCVFVWEIFF